MHVCRARKRERETVREGYVYIPDSPRMVQRDRERRDVAKMHDWTRVNTSRQKITYQQKKRDNILCTIEALSALSNSVLLVCCREHRRRLLKLNGLDLVASKDIYTWAHITNIHSTSVCTFVQNNLCCFQPSFWQILSQKWTVWQRLHLRVTSALPHVAHEPGISRSLSETKMSWTKEA